MLDTLITLLVYISITVMNWYIYTKIDEVKKENIKIFEVLPMNIFLILLIPMHLIGTIILFIIWVIDITTRLQKFA